MDSFLDIIFIPKCIFCSQSGRYICEKCISKIDLVGTDKCIVCNLDSRQGLTHTRCRSAYTPSRFITAFKYTTLARSVIRRSKYKSKEFMALKILSEVASRIVKPAFSELSSYKLVAVPLSEDKFRRRGFNQVDTIVKELSLQTGLRVSKNILYRAIDTGAQYSKNRRDRFRNVENVFKTPYNIQKLKTSGKYILVDDICTSGATLMAASKALYLAGAKDVICFTLSKKI